MDSLSDILANKNFSQPDEVTAIKSYVAKHFEAEVTVSLNNREIIISSQSASLISSLRMDSPKIIKASGTDKKIRFRVG